MQVAALGFKIKIKIKKSVAIKDSLCSITTLHILDSYGRWEHDLSTSDRVDKEEVGPLVGYNKPTMRGTGYKAAAECWVKGAQCGRAYSWRACAGWLWQAHDHWRSTAGKGSGSCQEKAQFVCGSAGPPGAQTNHGQVLELDPVSPPNYFPQVGKSLEIDPWSMYRFALLLFQKAK